MELLESFFYDGWFLAVILLIGLFILVFNCLKPESKTVPVSPIQKTQKTPETREELEQQLLNTHTCPCGYLGWQMAMFCDDNGCKNCIHFKGGV